MAHNPVCASALLCVSLQEEARKADIAQKVAAGLLPPDVLAEDLEMLPDAMDEIIADEQFEEDVSGAAGVCDLLA